MESFNMWGEKKEAAKHHLLNDSSSLRESQGSLENVLEQGSAEGGLQNPTGSAPAETFVAEITEGVQLFFSGWCR